MEAHASSEPFQMNMKMALFCLAHQSGGANVGLDASHEMDHPQAVFLAFWTGASESVVGLVQRMVLVDHSTAACTKRTMALQMDTEFNNLAPCNATMSLETTKEMRQHALYNHFVSCSLALKRFHQSCILWFVGLAISIPSYCKFINRFFRKS